MRSGDDIISPIFLRERAGLTQRQVAIALNKREATISEWERGVARPRLNFAETIKLMRLYKATIEELCIAFDRVNPEDI